jgi:hypothetical protein
MDVSLEVVRLTELMRRAGPLNPAERGTSSFSGTQCIERFFPQRDHFLQLESNCDIVAHSILTMHSQALAR